MRICNNANDVGGALAWYDRRAWRAEMTAVRREVRASMDIKAFEGADPVGSAGIALASLASIGATSVAVWAIWSLAGPAFAVPAYALGALFAARQQRALELLVHDGSHGAFNSRRRLNDVACDLLAAAPVVQLTGSYRRTHKLHHQQFGSDLDPCRDRMFIRPLGRGGIQQWVRSVLGALPGYVADYYGGVASTSWRPVAAALCWHSVAGALLAAGLGWQTAACVWLLFWAVPFCAVLPIIRMLAEADEHDYSQCCEAKGTFTNLGPLNRLIVHPAGDLYHLAHHAFPAVPISRLRRFDKAARRVSVAYRSMPIRCR